MSKIKCRASDFNIGDNIKYQHGKIFRSGMIIDHFGDGVMVELDSSISIDRSTPGSANPMGYNTDKPISSFELYDDEESMGLSIENLSII